MFLFTPAHAFLGFLDTDAELIGMGVDPILFFTLAIYETVRVAGPSGINASFFPQNDGSLALLTAAMNLLIDGCWEPAYASVAAHTRLYQRRSRCALGINVLVNGYKILMVLGVPVTFPHRNTPEQALGRLVSSDTDVDGDGEHNVATVNSLTRSSAKYASDFLLFAPNFAMGKHLHFLVYSYNWLQSRMAYRFTI